jgi:hypothetical protein
MSGRRVALFVGALMVALFFALGLGFIRSNAQTSDEAMHLVAGYSYLATHDFRLNPEHPALAKEWEALPLYLFYRLPFAPDEKQWAQSDETAIGERFLYQNTVGAETLLTVGRLPVLVLGCVLIALIGLWSYRLWGGWAAALSMAAAAVDPTLLAHSCVIHTDLTAALFTFLTFYCAWEYLRRPRLRWIAGAVVAIFLGIACKYSMAFLPVMLGFVLGAVALVERRFPLPRSPGDTLAFTAIAVCLASLIIPASYAFQGFSTWNYGMSIILNHQSGGHRAFLLGHYAEQGWWYYFPVAFVLKTAPGALALMIASIALLRRGTPLRAREALMLYGPVAITFGVMTQGQINIGLRHVLPVFPFLYVAVGRLATLRFSRRWLAPAACAVPLVAAAVSSLRVAPHQLAYFSDLVGGPAEGYKYLSDSNLDWGQDIKNLKQWLEDHNAPSIIYLSYFGNASPRYWGIRYQSVPPGPEVTSDRVPPGTRPELFAISAFHMQGVAADNHDLYRWLYKRTPIAKVGYSIFVFDITDDDDARAQIRRVTDECMHLPPGRRCGVWTTPQFP